MVALTEHDTLSRETVRRRLAENTLKPWREKMWCIADIDAAYVARMEDVLDLYAEPPDPTRPVVCFDESPTQLIGEVRTPIAARPGRLARFDSEYRRNGTANLFVFLDVHAGWRHVKVTDRRAGDDFAACMRDLVDIHYPDAARIRVVMDNLSTHTTASLYRTFPAPEARRILRKIEVHYTPKHASWLNMVEIEIGVLRGQCLDRRIGDRAQARTRDRRLGNAAATSNVPASTGCSPRTKPERKWQGSTSRSYSAKHHMEESNPLCGGTRSVHLAAMVCRRTMIGRRIRSLPAVGSGTDTATDADLDGKLWIS